MEFQQIFENKVVLITGGTGFLGKALVEEILKYNPLSIRIFSRDEVKHHLLYEKFNHHKKLRPLIGDVRDYSRLNKAMQGVDIVIHAAALKRLDLLEYNVEESIKTNVLGTLNVVNACLENNVEKAVFISTDKACSPVNTYGACKFVSERIFTESNYSKGSKRTIFTCVRYGNVLESTGSVIPFFETKIKNGEKIPLTDSRMTRFIITPKQAVELVFNALEHGIGGEVFVPKLPAFRVIDLIEILKEKHNVNNEIELIGIRPGEKVHELMINNSEISRTFSFKNMYIITSAIQKYQVINVPNEILQDKHRLSEENIFEYSSKDSVVTKEEVKELFHSYGILIPSSPLPEKKTSLQKAAVNKIPYGRQNLTAEDFDEVVKVLKSDYLTTGPKIEEFETKFAGFTGSKYAVAVSSGTAALHLACLAAELKKDDELITTPMTFAASANCALYCDAKPIFVDIKENGLIDESKIEEKISSRSKIIIPVHYAGLPCNLEKIKEIARKNNLTVIEDACHALGARYKNTKIGDCSFSDMAIFSFHPVKHITTGEGGMITTNSKELYEKLLILRTHGITKDKEKLTNKNEGPWYYEMQHLGFNYRITDFQCALGQSQLNKAEEFIARRRSIAKRYDQAFENDCNLEIIKDGGETLNSYHLYVIKVKNGETRLKLFNFLKERNILCQIHYIPVYWHLYYQKIGYAKGICPGAESFYERILSIPIYSSLSEEEQDFVIQSIKDFFEIKQ